MIFHNALASSGPTRVTVDAEPKWTKKNNYMVELTLHTNPPQSVAYWAENNACGEFFKGKKGQTFTITATGGGKDEAAKASAAIIYVGEAGQTAPPPQQHQPVPVNPPPSQQRGPAPTANGRPDGLKAVKVFIGRNESVTKIALRRFQVLYKEAAAAGETIPDAILPSVYGSLLYGVSGQGYTDLTPPCIDYKTLLPVSGAHALIEAPAPPPKIMCEKCDAVEVPNKGDWCDKCKATDDVPF